jgi:hypothetical protein
VIVDWIKYLSLDWNPDSRISIPDLVSDLTLDLILNLKDDLTIYVHCGPSELDAGLDPRLRAQLDYRLDGRLDPGLDFGLERRFDSRLDPGLDPRLEIVLGHRYSLLVLGLISDLK